MPRLFLVCCLWLLAGASLAADSPLPDNILAALKQARLPASSLSLLLQPAAQPAAALWQHQADAPRNPASTIKLLTTLAALETLGPQHRFNTELWSDGEISDGVLHGNLYLKGGGDPKLGLENLWLLLRQLRQQDVQQIDGDLVQDHSLYQLPPDTAPAFDGKAEHPYQVSPDALLINFKSVQLQIDADAQAVRARLEPPLANIRLRQQIKLRTTPCPQWRQGLQWQIGGDEQQAEIRLSGSFPANCRGELYLSALGSQAYNDGIVRLLWQEMGGKLLGQSRQGAVPSMAHKLAESPSLELALLIRDINKYSNNLMARMVYLNLAAAGPEDSHVRAERSVRDWLARQRLEFPELVLENGSGLSRKERISARHLAALLAHGWISPYAADYVASLPILGLDGTLKKRGQDNVAQARLKTGTLNDVKALAGYLRGPQGEPYILVAIINHPDAGRYQAVLDTIVSSALASLPAHSPPSSGTAP